MSHIEVTAIAAFLVTTTYAIILGFFEIKRRKQIVSMRASFLILALVAYLPFVSNGLTASQTVPTAFAAATAAAYFHPSQDRRIFMVIAYILSLIAIFVFFVIGKSTA